MLNIVTYAAIHSDPKYGFNVLKHRLVRNF